MRNKLILFLMLALFGSSSFLRADELTVHDESGTNSYVPVYGFYADAFLKCEMVFPAAELADMENGTISGITFYASSPATEAWTGTFQVFVAEVADATISAFAGPGTVVYEGTLDGSQSSMQITFNAPYAYNGGNLLVGVYCTTKGNYKSVTWAGESVDGASVQGYSYNDLSSITPSQRNFLPKTTFTYTAGSGPVPPTPPVPTGELTITPNPFVLGERPTNGWMEPYAVKISNGGEETTIEATISNTSGLNPFALSTEINQTLATDEVLDFTIDINNTVADGDYTEEFTLFYTGDDKSIITIPVTSTFYTAGEADIVETAKTLSLSYTSGVANFSHTPADLHANYLLAGMTEMKVDAVYKMNLTKDSKVTVNNNVAFFPYASDFQPSAAEAPAFEADANDEVIVFAGNYYMIVTGDAIATVEGTVEQIPAPTELVALLPEDGAMGISGNVELTWEGGDNATQYQVLFGTSPVNMDIVLDWTPVDANFGSYTVNGLANNTQYFWQIKAKNSSGMVQTARRGFTTTLTAPNTVTASETEIFTDGSTLIKWKHSAGAAGVLPETQIGEGTTTNAYLPTYNLYNYSLSEQIYTGEEIGGAGIINSISFYPVGSITRNLKIYMANTDKTSFTSGSDWVAMEADNLVYEGNVAMVANTWVTIELDEPFEFDGSNLLLAVTDHTGTWTSSIQYRVFNAASQAINVYQDSAPYNATAPSGSGTVRAFKNQIVINKDGAKAPDMNRGFLGFNLYYGVNNAGVYDYTKVNTELITEKQYLLEGLAYNMDGYDINVTAVYDEGESGHSSPDNVTVMVSGYGTFTGTVTNLIGGAPMAGVNVKFSGTDEFGNNVSFEGTTNASGVYTINNVKAGTYNGRATLEGNEPSNAEANPVTLAYNTTETVNFVMHEEYKPVFSVYAEEIDPSMSKITWSMTTAITGGGVGGSASTFAENFDSGTMPAGWTTIDANNDGYNWVFGSAIGGIYLASGASLAGTGHNSSADMICSGSYSNATSQAITPDNYLVTPQVMLAPGSTFSFWACAQDASYAAEHYGVFIADNATGPWTMVQEWTMTAKGEGAMSIGRDGQTRAQGNWYQKSVDLSSYVGQKYIAIRHFNCNDQFILNVDDVELTAGSKGRDVETYTLVRKAILKETAITAADSVTLAENYTDTLYADFDWFNREPGLYQYGVSAHYPTPPTGGKGNRNQIVIGDPTATTTNNYLPTYSLYNYSLTQQIYTADEIGVAGTINTLTMWLKNSSSYARNINVYMKEIAETTFAGTTAWVSMTDSDMVGSFTLANGISSPVETAIALSTPFSYSGTGNLVICFQDVTGSWSSGAASVVMTGNGNQAIYAYRDASVYNPTTPGATGYLSTNKSVIMLDITAGGGAAGNDNPVTDFTWSNILPKDMDAVVVVNAQMATGTAEGATIEFVNDFEENYNFNAEMDETGTYIFSDFRKGNYFLTASLPGYVATIEPDEVTDLPVSVWSDTVTFNITFSEDFKPVQNLYVSGTGYAIWDDMLPHDEPERVAERYHVTLEDIFQGLTTDNFMQLNVENLTVGETYTAAVALVYTTGMSDFTEATFTYLGCEATATQVEELEGHAECMDVVLTWNGGVAPGPTPPTPTPPTGNDFNFDDGTFMGWTTIDANNDGYNWVMGSQIGGVYLVSGASLAGTGHNSSNDMVCSGSYSNASGAAITPDNYLVSPTKAEYTGISFWACAQDASYAAEHYGVAVSTAGNTSASDFTIVQEWTMTAKGDGAMSIGRDGQTRAQGAWYQKTVDLSAYAGQDIWVAIRHFNCNDQFILNVDDITLGTPDKGHADADWCGVSTPAQPSRDMWDLVTTFTAAEGGHYGVVTDGQYFYTSNWGYSSAAHNFYKYDLDGTMIEGFEIAGCGTLRGMTFDGQYVYGVANSSTIYCVDLNNHTLVGTTTSAYGAMRGITYDAQRNGFWVIGNWSGNLTLVDRTGAIVQVGPAPTSASDLAYYKDPDGVEHVYCFNNADNGVYDYNITTNTMGGSVFNFSSTPGFNSGSSGGCHVAAYNGKTCFIGDIQQSPNLIGIYELDENAGPSGGGASTVTPGKFNIFKDGEVIGTTNNPYYTYEAEDTDEHLYEVYYVDANYNFSCAVEGVTVAAGGLDPVTELTAEFVEDPAGVNLTWEGVGESYQVFVNGELEGTTTNTEYLVTGLGDGEYTFGVVAVAGDCESEMVEVTFIYDDVNENQIVNALYPNPTSGDLHINANGMTRIMVVNALGQMVYNAEVDTDEVILNMGQYNAGIYMVNIVTVNGSTVKRVVVTK